MNDTVKAFDWGTTPLGAKATWSPALRTTYDIMVSSSFGMCAMWGPERTLLYNEAYAPFLGARHPEALGRPIDEVWHELWDQIGPLIDRAMAGEEVSFRDLHLVMTRNGYEEDTWWTFSYSPLFDDGRVVGMLNITTDTTEAVVSRQRAISYAERVQLALAAGAIIGTWVWDLPTDRFTVDEAFATNFGLDPALGREGLSLAQVVETVHPDDQQGLADAISEVISRGGRYAHQYRVRRRDGRYYWLEANGRVELGDNGTALRFPGVLLDVQERRAIADERDTALVALRQLNETLEQRVRERTMELEQAETALRQAQKMEAVGQLTGGLAHDFNNLLAGITGSLELMERRVGQGRYQDVPKYISAAQNAASRAAALTHRLLAFSRRQTLQPTTLDINQLVEGMVDLVSRSVGPGIRIDLDLEAALAHSLIDAPQLENALLNLCLNARDAMPGGGALCIRTRNEVFDPRSAVGLGMTPGEYVALSVTDEGVGMTPEVAAKAFDPFFTTKPLGAGTGLGLSMIYGFAVQSGGRAVIESEPGCGTTVRLLLPKSSAQVLSGTADAVPASDQRHSSGTALVVDDEPTVRLMVKDALEDMGFDVVEAGDSQAGLQILRSDRAIDFMVTDVGLPGGLNGRQLADAARSLRKLLPILFITGYAESSVIGSEALPEGMAVLTKPFSVNALSACVSHMQARGPARSR